jgi:hypothetical protein
MFSAPAPLSHPLPLLPCLLALLTVTVAPPLLAQGMHLGAGFGFVKPQSVSTAPAGVAWLRVGVSSSLALQVDLSGWTVTIPDTVLVVVGTDPLGNPIFAEQELDFPVSDLSLGLTPTVRLPLGRGWQVVGGAGVRVHYLVSDLRRLEIDGDSEVRVGLHLLGGIEVMLGSRVGIYAWPRLDLVKDIDQIGLLAGVVFAL